MCECKTWHFPWRPSICLMNLPWPRCFGHAVYRHWIKLRVPSKWVVDCRHVGKGKPALTYLARYLYRGVINERDIVSNKDGVVTFRYVNGETGKTCSARSRVRTFAGWYYNTYCPKAFAGSGIMGFYMAMRNGSWDWCNRCCRWWLKRPVADPDRLLSVRGAKRRCALSGSLLRIGILDSGSVALNAGHWLIQERLV